MSFYLPRFNPILPDISTDTAVLSLPINNAFARVTNSMDKTKAQKLLAISKHICANQRWPTTAKTYLSARRIQNICKL